MTRSFRRSSVQAIVLSLGVFLALKDWVTSTLQSYPYTQSIGLSIAPLVAALAASYVRQPRIWRDLLVVLAASACLAVLCQRNASLFINGFMPAAGILACAFALPNHRGMQSLKAFVRAPRTVVYGLAVCIGFAALVQNSGLIHSSRLAGAELGLATIALAIIIERCIVLRRTSRAARIGLLVAIGSPIALYCSQLKTVGMMGSFPTHWLGEGLASAALSQENLNYFGQILVYEQGIVTTLVIGICLSASLLLYISSLTQRVQPANDLSAAPPAASEDQTLASGAITALIVLLFCVPCTSGLFLSNTIPATWTFDLSIASLAIAVRSHAYAPQTAPIPIKPIRLKTAAAALALLAASALAFTTASFIPITGSGLTLHALSEGRYPGRSTDFLPLSSMPPVLLREAHAESSVRVTGEELHNIMRRMFGRPVVPLRPSMALDLAARITGATTENGAGGELRTAIFASLITACLSRDRIVELYLNTLDYGVPQVKGDPDKEAGVAAASLYYFHQPLAHISTSQARFLLAGNRYYAMVPGFHFARSGPAPRFDGITTSRYRCDELASPLTGGNSFHHEGDLNSKSEVVSSSSRGRTENYPFVWHAGHFRFLPGLQARMQTGFVVKINDLGDAAGWSFNDQGERAVIWDSSGGVQDLGVLPGFNYSVARGINNHKQVVGFCWNVPPSGISIGQLSTEAHAFLWEHGIMRDLGVAPGCMASRAYAINDFGQVAGSVVTEVHRTHAMVWENGVMHDLGTFSGGNDSLARAINNAGQVVGSADHADKSVTAFLWQDGVMHDLGLLPGSTHAKAFSINDRGQVAGVSIPDSDYNAGKGSMFVWDGLHGMSDPISKGIVDPPREGTLTDRCMAFAINDGGTLLATTYFTDKRGWWRRMFLLTPVH